jgi:L-asparaginase II
MITLARHLGVPIAGYSRVDHPVQRRIADILCDMTGLVELPAPAIDGCGAPTWPLPLCRIATAMARFAHPDGLLPARAAACVRLRAAMAAHPYLLAGTDRACTEIMTAAPHVLVKAGAEGVHAACLPEQRLGLALKVEDGAGRPRSLCSLFWMRRAPSTPRRRRRWPSASGRSCATMRASWSAASSPPPVGRRGGNALKPGASPCY